MSCSAAWRAGLVIKSWTDQPVESEASLSCQLSTHPATPPKHTHPDRAEEEEGPTWWMVQASVRPRSARRRRSVMTC